MRLSRIAILIAVLVTFLVQPASADFVQYEIMGTGGQPAVATSNETNCMLSAPASWVGGFVKMQGAPATAGPWTDISNSTITQPGSIPVALPSPLPAYLRLYEQLAGTLNQPYTYLGCGVGGIGGGTTQVGVSCDGTTDNTTAIQNAITKVLAANGGTVLLTGACKAHGLTVAGSNLLLVGVGGGSDDGTITPGTTLTYNGSSGGTLITFSTPCATPTCTLHASNVGLANMEIGSGKGLAAHGVIFKGIFHAFVQDVTWIYDGGFTTNVFDLTFDTNLNIPGTDRAFFNRLMGSDATGVTFELDGTYSDYFGNIYAGFTNGDLFHFGGGATVNDETDTDTLINVVGQGNAGTGYAFDLDCDSNQIYGYSIDPGSPSSQVGIVRGTTSCAGKQSVSYANQFTNYAYTTLPTVESGGGLVVRDSQGDVVGTTLSTHGYYSFNSNIPAFFGTTKGNPVSFYGAMNTDNTPILFGNTTGTNGITRIGSDSGSTCAGISATVFAIINNGSANCFAFDNSGAAGSTKYVSTGGVQPNGTGGGYSAEVFPLGVKSTHPQILTGTCASVSNAGTSCTFPNSFAFADTTYTCTATVDDSAKDYVAVTAKTTTSITLTTGSATHNADYTCIR